MRAAARAVSAVTVTVAAAAAARLYGQRFGLMLFVTAGTMPFAPTAPLAAVVFASFATIVVAAE